MTRILHITHVSNLPSIIQSDGLWSLNHIPQGITVKYSAHSTIQQRRARKRVPCSPSGVLNDYVPFYFGERSPMLYANHKGWVAGNTEGQRPIVYLVSDVGTVARHTNDWVFTDGHAIMTLTAFFNTTSDLNQVDWNVVRARSWHDTIQDPDRKRRKQAEFLVHRFFPFAWVTEIVVIDTGMARNCSRTLSTLKTAPPVRINPRWYY